MFCFNPLSSRACLSHNMLDFREDWEKTFTIDLFQTVRMIRLAGPHIRKRGGGCIINRRVEAESIETLTKTRYSRSEAGSQVVLAAFLA